MMDWAKLLSSKRIRELDGGSASGVNDHRTSFQSDYDRLIFSAPVKRLQDKAQVFPLEPNDSVRTRLTHSLEVSSVARGMGQCVGERLLKESKVTTVQARAIEDICGAAGLVHDIGNPPFGHFGEDAISAWFTTPTGKNALGPLDTIPELRDDFVQFEGNARTLRLLCHLQVLSDQYGLNLTAATLAASMKYVVPSHRADKESAKQSFKKPGYCFAEGRFVDLIRQEIGAGEVRHPLAHLVEAADDCVYSICDIEDGVKKGIISFAQAVQGLATFAGEHGHLIEDVGNRAKVNVDRGMKTVGGSEGTGRALDEAYMQMFRVISIGKIIDDVCTAFGKNYTAIMDGGYDGELVCDDAAPTAKTFVQSAKKFGKKKIYVTRPTIELELRGGHIIQSLLDRLWLGIDSESLKTPAGKRYRSLISESYKNVNAFELQEEMKSNRMRLQETALKRYYDLMLITDYVCGMTDSFASNLERSLTNG